MEKVVALRFDCPDRHRVGRSRSSATDEPAGAGINRVVLRRRDNRLPVGAWSAAALHAPMQSARSSDRGSASAQE